jgi:hypothetical protein
VALQSPKKNQIKESQVFWAAICPGMIGAGQKNVPGVYGLQLKIVG